MDRTYVVPLQIARIERITLIDTVYNFSVDGDESYVLNGVISHNCRCDLAPVTKELADKLPRELGDFETWLRK